jgi:hypothetical protein
MAKSKPPEWVRWPTSINKAAFHADPSWRDRQRQLGIICPRCNNLRHDRIGDVDQLVVTCEVPDAGHFTGVWDYGGAVPKLLSKKVLVALSSAGIDRIGRIVRIVTSNGVLIDSHAALVAHGVPGTIRTRAPDPPSICAECGHFGYWPNWPPSKWQLLRSYWPTGAELVLIGNWLLCSDDLWAQTIEPLKLPRVKGHKVALVDEPADGLPADYDELVAEVRRRGWIS